MNDQTASLAGQCIDKLPPLDMTWNEELRSLWFQCAKVILEICSEERAKRRLMADVEYLSWSQR